MLFLAIRCQAANVTVNVHDLASGAVANRTVSVTLIKPAGSATVGPWVISGDSLSQQTDLNGVTTFTNMLTLGGYRLDIAGTPSRSFPFSLPVTNGAYNVTQLIGTNFGVDTFYTASQVDALLASSTNGGPFVARMSGLSTNLGNWFTDSTGDLWTNNGQKWYDVSHGGAFGTGFPAMQFIRDILALNTAVQISGAIGTGTPLLSMSQSSGTGNFVEIRSNGVLVAWIDKSGAYNGLFGNGSGLTNVAFGTNAVLGGFTNLSAPITISAASNAVAMNVNAVASFNHGAIVIATNNSGGEGVHIIYDAGIAAQFGELSGGQCSIDYYSNGVFYGNWNGSFGHVGSPGGFELGAVTIGGIHLKQGFTQTSGAIQYITIGNGGPPLGTIRIAPVGDGFAGPGNPGNGEPLQFDTVVNDDSTSILPPMIIAYTNSDARSSSLEIQNPGPSPGSPTWVRGTMQQRWMTNGVSLRGRLVQERVTDNANGSTYVLDFSKAKLVDITVSTSSTVTFSTANELGGSTNFEPHVFYIRSSGVVPSLSFPVTPVGWNTNTVPMPSTFPVGSMIRLELEKVGIGETNVQVVSIQTNIDNTFSWDADALAFFTRANVTDTGQKGAINQFVQGLKSDGTWTILDTFYPCVGASGLTSYTKNLVANTFNITWTGTTAASKGAQFNGTTDFGDTGFTPSSAGGHFTQNSCCMGAYVSVATGWTDPGALMGAVNNTSFRILRNSGFIQARAEDNTDMFINPTANFVAPFLVTRTGSTASAIADPTTYNSDATASAAFINASIYIGAQNNGGVSAPSAVTVGCAWIGGGMTSGQWASFRTRVQTLMASLGR